VPNPDPTNTVYLDGVSCVSASACTAAGADYTSTQGGPLIESWNGSTWSVVPSPDKDDSSAFNGVSCASANACTAVGYYQAGALEKTLIESWNGATWSVVPSPNKRFGANANNLAGVSCTAAGACVAVGHFTKGTNVNRTLAESNGAGGGG
jgi:hypothetical protein